MWADRLALDGEEHLRQGHSGAAFANFCQLRETGPRISAPIHDSSGSLLSDQAAILSIGRPTYSAYVDLRAAFDSLMPGFINSE